MKIVLNNCQFYEWYSPLPLLILTKSDDIIYYIEVDINEPQEYPKQMVISMSDSWVCEYRKGLGDLTQQLESIVEKCHKTQGDEESCKNS